MAHALSFEGTDLRREPEKVQATLLGTSPSSSSWHINLMLMVLVKWALEQWAGEEAWLSSWCWALATPFPASLLSGSFSLPFGTLLSTVDELFFSCLNLAWSRVTWLPCHILIWPRASTWALPWGHSHQLLFWSYWLTEAALCAYFQPALLL